MDEDKGFATGSTYWSDAQTTVAAVTGLSAFKWQGGLYQAAKDHVNDLAASGEISVTGSDSSTPATRAAKYGAGTTSEDVFGDDYTPVIYALALVAEAGSSANMLSADHTHLALAKKDFTSSLIAQKSVADFIFTSDFVSASPYSECEAPVVATAVVPTGAMAIAFSAASLSAVVASLI